MKGWGGAAVAVVLLWLAGVLQEGLSPRLAIGPGAPDFPIVILSVLGLFGDRKSDTWLGFGAGFVTGALAGADMTLYVATRSVAGFLLGWFNTLDVQTNLAAAVVSAVVLTLVSQLLLLFLGVQHGPILPFLGGTLTTAVYDGVIAVPFYLLLSRVLVGPNRRLL